MVLMFFAYEKCFYCAGRAESNTVMKSSACKTISKVIIENPEKIYYGSCPDEK